MTRSTKPWNFSPSPLPLPASNWIRPASNSSTPGTPRRYANLTNNPKKYMQAYKKAEEMTRRSKPRIPCSPHSSPTDCQTISILLSETIRTVEKAGCSKRRLTGPQVSQNRRRTSRYVEDFDEPRTTRDDRVQLPVKSASRRLVKTPCTKAAGSWRLRRTLGVRRKETGSRERREMAFSPASATRRRGRRRETFLPCPHPLQLMAIGQVTRPDTPSAASRRPSSPRRSAASDSCRTSRCKGRRVRGCSPAPPKG